MYVTCAHTLVADIAFAPLPLCTAAVVNVPPKGANLTQDTSPYNLSCPEGSYITLFSVTLDTTFPLDPKSDPDGKSSGTVIVQMGPFECSRGGANSTTVEGKPLRRNSSDQDNDGSTFLLSPLESSSPWDMLA